MYLDGHSLCGSTLLPPWDPVLLHLTFHSISPGFILQIRGWRKPQTCLHQISVPSLLKDPNFSKVRPTFEAAIVIVIRVRGG